MRHAYSIVVLGCAAVLALATCSAQAATYADMPDPVMTPGRVATTDTAKVCEKDYPAKSRKVSKETRDGIYYRYKVDPQQCRGGCKIDHLIPLAIGGSNAVDNLWPHEYGAEHNVYKKTRLEVRLRKEVCGGSMPITEAQQCIQSNWQQCYVRFYGGFDQ